MLSFWFSAVAASAWALVAVLRFAGGDQRLALLAGAAALCFGAAFVVRLVERRRET